MARNSMVRSPTSSWSEQVSSTEAPERLRADCDRCVALCCVALAFEVSADFAIDKEPGVPCPNLGEDLRCRVHADLRSSGMRGCAAFDCFGAGQRVSQELFPGFDWRTQPERAPEVYEVFHVLRALHALLWCIEEAVDHGISPEWQARLGLERARLEEVAQALPQDVGKPEASIRWMEANEALSELSAELRAAGGGPCTDHRGALLFGKDLRAEDLRGASLRGAKLIGVDLRGACLELTDLAGADLRGARLHGADLRGSLFLSQMQLDQARGDHSTLLPAKRERPPEWGDR